MVNFRAFLALSLFALIPASVECMLIGDLLFHID